MFAFSRGGCRWVVGRRRQGMGMGMGMRFRRRLGCGAGGALRPCEEDLHGTAASWIVLASTLR